MSTLQQVIASIHSLDPAEKLVVRNFLEHELNAPSTADVSPPSLIGLLADDPELADSIADSAMRDRETRPWRLGDE